MSGIENFEVYGRHFLVYFGDLSQMQFRTPNELRGWCNCKKVLGVANPYDFDCDSETSYWYVLQDRFREIAEYESTNTRRKIRGALARYRFELVSNDVMLQLGYSIYCQAFQRYALRPPLTEAKFRQQLRAQMAYGENYWMAFDNDSGRPAAYISVLVRGSSVFMNFERLSSDFTQHSPIYGFIYTLTEYYLRECGYLWLVSGARTVREHSKVQEQKITRLQFRKAYCRLQLELVPWLRIATRLLYPFRKLLRWQKTLTAFLKLYEYAEKSQRGG